MSNVDTQEKIDRVLRLMEENSFLTLKAQAATLLPLFFESAEELFCIIDKDQRFLRVSNSWTTELGFAKTELEGHRFLDFVYHDDKEDTNEAFLKYNFTDANIDRYYFNRYKKKEGGYVWLRWIPNLENAYTNTGFIIGIASVVTDQATIKLLEQHRINNHE